MESLITCSCVNSICSLINYWSFDVRTLALSCTEIFIHSITMIMNSLSTFNYMVDRWDFWYLDRLQKYNYMYMWLHVWKKNPTNTRSRLIKTVLCKVLLSSELWHPFFCILSNAFSRSILQVIMIPAFVTCCFVEYEMLTLISLKHIQFISLLSCIVTVIIWIILLN